MLHFYDDPEFTYTDYWTNRQYEHQSELLAISRLLGKRKFKQVVDIGGGYGRLLPHLNHYCKSLTLIEPSLKQRQIAKDFLKKIKEVKIVSGTADKTKLKTGIYDLVIMIRVMHHLPQPESTFKELARLLAPKGLIILEFANALNFKARVISMFRSKPILPIPVEKRSKSNIDRGSIDFVSHHPLYIKKLLARYGLKVIEILSVSNFRFEFLKKILPLPILLSLEKVSQKLLASAYYGPSIFFLLKKVDKI